jgi:hypothetical protein
MMGVNLHREELSQNEEEEPYDLMRRVSYLSIALLY